MALNAKNLSSDRQKLYKFTTPPWKEVYRKKCVENLRRRRQDLLDKFRRCERGTSVDVKSHVELAMTEEWQALRENDSQLPSCSELMFGKSEDAEINYINSIMEEIQRSLRDEEDRLIEIYCKDYEEMLCSELENKARTDELIICPICQKHVLLFNKNVIFCKCGMRLNTELDALRLKDLRRSLEQTKEEHDQQCEHTASYSVVNTFSIDNLLITCQRCDFMRIVL